MVIRSDKDSMRGADVYIEVTQDTPAAKMATIAGTFFSKVFEGHVRNMRKWIEEMKAFLQSKGKNFETRATGENVP